MVKGRPVMRETSVMVREGSTVFGRVTDRTHRTYGSYRWQRAAARKQPTANRKR